MRVHISLDTRSLEDSQEFYSRLFGQSASKVRNGYANFRLEEPPIHLALVESALGAGAGASHYGVELPDAAALQAWRERLEAAGVELRREDQAQCCYAEADKLWLTDPDGRAWEIWHRTGEYADMRPAEAGACGGTACCAGEP